MPTPVSAANTPVLSDRAEHVGIAAYWELLVNLTKREVKGRYSQSLFGFGWAIIQPLATMAVFTFVFSHLGNISGDGVPYPIFAYAGLVPWFFFLNSVNSGTMSLITYRNIVTKTYFPREIIPFSQVCSRLLDFFAAGALFAILLVYDHVGLTRWAWMAPLAFLLLVLFTTGVTLITSSVNVFYRDVSPVVQIALQLWLYVTPVAYPLSRLKPQWRFWIVLNPLSGIVEGFRSSLVYGRAPDWQVLGISAAFTVAVFGGAFVLFKKLDRYFADVI
jgi:homopolymeric O-antigen transport system permease protein